ncbi:oxidoreductase (plasmid) [Deinococcus aetherius]|uniref:Oxidoreductase n=1 Tax=Deinococcus aetherius TaxID=200252 RepID=A0ABN6RNL0_9DEIO|nr:alpha/beta hydrolase [Deinococcus aetherius]BDP44415.1 oxidoreductase [Deinococcus aetherius]
MTSPTLRAGYAPVNGLRMYYEVHGTGAPLVVLHGAYMTVDLLGGLVSELAGHQRVIAPELQGHGHTADSGRPLSYEGMADDVAALLAHLGISQADVLGYSMGGAVALQLAIRHPQVVRKLVVASASCNSEGVYPELLEGIEQMTPEVFDGTPWKEAYDRVAPNPEEFGVLVDRLKALDLEVMNWPAEAIQAIRAPTLLIVGDADIVRPEHAVELFRLLGGGVAGDLTGLPAARLAVLPGTTHTAVLDRASWLRPMILEFLDAPLPEGTAARAAVEAGINRDTPGRMNDERRPAVQL